MTLFMDLHVVQVLPPNNLNRDDTGSPKTCLYGGVTRARVSSQAWKHEMRKDFHKIFDEKDLGYRTLQATSLIADHIMKLDANISKEDAEEKAVKILDTAGIKTKKGTINTEALTFISEKQAEKLAELALDNKIMVVKPGKAEKEAVKKAFAENPSIDIALFGRMVASEPFLNFDATAQVAHALSTHAVEREFDYFTATDDLQGADQTGAGHIGTSEYNSSTVYRYSTVNLSELSKTLGTQTPEVAAGFLQAFALSLPKGKSTTFAVNTVPSDIYVSLRDDQPVSFAAAFEAPVKADENGYVKNSVDRLKEYADDVEQFVKQPVEVYTVGKDLEGIGYHGSLNQVKEKLKTDIETKLGKGVA